MQPAGRRGRWWPALAVVLLLPSTLLYFTIAGRKTRMITSERQEISVLETDAARLLVLMDGISAPRGSDDQASFAALISTMKADEVDLLDNTAFATPVGRLISASTEFRRVLTVEQSSSQTTEDSRRLVSNFGVLAAQAAALDRIYADAAHRIENRTKTVGLLFEGLLVAVLAVLLRRSMVRTRVRDLEAGERHGQEHSEHRLRALVQDGDDMIVVFGPNGEFKYRSPATSWALGDPNADVPPLGFPEVLHPDDFIAVGSTLAEVFEGTLTSGMFECRIRHVDGGWRRCEIKFRNLLDDPDIQGIVLNGRDVTDARALEEQLADQALHDSLTGLANRVLFKDRIERALVRADRNPTEMGIVLLDIDDFKTVNEGLGISAGDRILTEMARRLTACVRAEDTVARLGGDEFGLLIERADRGLAAIARRIFDALHAPFRDGTDAVHLTGSIGIRRVDLATGTVDDLMRDADVAMFEAKAAGKDCFRWFDPLMRDAALARLQLKIDLRAAVGEQFFLVYQPVVELESQRVIGAEALIRWEHPTRGTIGPSEFIPLAEATGLIFPIGSWVLDEAYHQLAAWQGEFPTERPLRMGINVSIKQLESDSFLDQVRTLVASAKCPAESIVLEVTESVAADDGAIRRLFELRDLGVSVAIDDFGVGYSSLSALRDYPADVVKIDRSFVTQLGTPGADTAMIRGIIRLAGDLGMRTLAEGIETVEQLVSVRDLGCTLGQGYYFAKPLHASEMAAFIGSHRGARSSSGSRAPASTR